jgi:hypothetical protein
MNVIRRFKSYVNLGTTEKKVQHLLKNFEFTTFEKLLPEGFRRQRVAHAAACR